MSIKYQILFRACDKVESVHKVARPYGLNKTEIIKVSFYSIYHAIQSEEYLFTIIGDDLSNELLNFFRLFDNVVIDNDNLGSAAKSLQKRINHSQIPSFFILSILSWHIVCQSTNGVITPSVIWVERP